MNIYRCWGKRLFDILFSILGIIVLTPFISIIAIGVKLTSAGPVIFAQERLGKDGRLLRVYKFRTMYVDDQIDRQAFEPGMQTRVTPLGRFLRKTKLDELPQLFNVIKGDLSFVGPRPEVPLYKPFYRDGYACVLSVRPGITDRASIKYYDEEMVLSRAHFPEQLYREVILPDKLDMNKKYVEKEMSMWTDVVIILETLNVLAGR